MFERSSLTLPSGAHGGASRHQYNATCQAVKRRPALLRDDAGAVAADAVVGRVLVVVREGVEAGEALKSAGPAGREVVPTMVGDGDPGVAEAVGGGGIRAAIADGPGKRCLGPSGQRDRG